MKRKYKMQHKKEKYEIDVELSVIYWIAEEVVVGDEAFIVIERIWNDTDF